MAKKKIKKSKQSLVKKGIALFASLFAFVAMFLNLLNKKNVLEIAFNDEKSVEKVSVNFFKYLVDDGYQFQLWREQFSMATTIMWIVFVAVCISLVLTVLGMVMKKGSLFSKVGAIILVVGLLVLNLVNVDVVEIANYTTHLTNFSFLYFAVLLSSFVGVGAVFYNK